MKLHVRDHEVEGTPEEVFELLRLVCEDHCHRRTGREALTRPGNDSISWGNLPSFVGNVSNSITPPIVVKANTI